MQPLIPIAVPEIVDDSVNQGKSMVVPAAAGAAGIGLGAAVLGPGLGMPLGATLSGAYVGGSEGNIITLTGMMFGLASLVFGNPFQTVSTSSGGGRRRM